MQVPLGDTIYGRECIIDSTGAAIDADALPTIDVSENGAAPAAMGGTVADIGVGLIRWTLPCTTGNGFEVGKWYDVVINATVGGKASSKRVALFQIIAATVTAGYQEVRESTVRTTLTTIQTDSAAGLTFIAGLLQNNTRVDKQTYDGNGNMTGARIRVFSSKANANASTAWNGATPADNAEGEIARYSIVATFSGPGACTSYKLVQDL